MMRVGDIVEVDAARWPTNWHGTVAVVSEMHKNDSGIMVDTFDLITIPRAANWHLSYFKLYSNNSTDIMLILGHIDNATKEIR